MQRAQRLLLCRGALEDESSSNKKQGQDEPLLGSISRAAKPSQSATLTALGPAGPAPPLPPPEPPGVGVETGTEVELADVAGAAAAAPVAAAVVRGAAAAGCCFEEEAELAPGGGPADASAASGRRSVAMEGEGGGECWASLSLPGPAAR